jgi:hypothetical protein
MKNKFSRAVLYINGKFRIDQFANRHFSRYPQFVKVFSLAMPLLVVGAGVAGASVLGWQIVSLAREGEVRVASVNGGDPVTGNFEAKVIFTASQDRQPFNIRMFIDGNVISSKVGSAIKKGDVRDYKFASGIGGENKFDVNLLKPGEHTLRVEAKTGSVVGDGADIDADNLNFTVKDVKNLAALGDEGKTFHVNELPGPAPGRSAAAPLPGLPSRLMAAVFPKAEAATRHGGFNVITRTTDASGAQRIPNVPISLVSHPAFGNWPCSTSPNSTDASGIAQFRDCVVSTQGADSATYTITIGATPGGYSITSDHTRTVTVPHNGVGEINFVYSPPAAADPGPTPGGGSTPDPGPAPDPVYNYQPSGHEPLIALTGLTATSATIDAFGMQMADNNIINYLKEVSVAIDGTRFSASSSFTIYATQGGLTLPLPDLNGVVADGHPHTLSFIAINQNGKSSTLNVVIAPPPPAGGGSSGGGSGPETSGGTGGTPPVTDHEKGSIEVSAYAHPADGQKLDADKDARVGAVYITATNIGTSVSQCDKQNGLTVNSRERADNFGRIHFRDCPVAVSTADNHAKKYRVTMSVPAGFVGTGTVVSREVTVKKDAETKVSFILVGRNTNTVGGSQPGSTTTTTQPTEDRSKPFPETGPDARGYLIISNDDGRFDRIKFYVDDAKGPTIGGISNGDGFCMTRKSNSSSSDPKLGEGNWAEDYSSQKWLVPSGATHARVVGFGSSTYITGNCSASAFFFNFFRPGDPLSDVGLFKNPRVAANITANHCTYVRYGEVTRVAAIQNDGSCPKYPDIGIQPHREETKLTGRYNPLPYVIGQSYTYEHELSLADGRGISPIECAGDIRIVHVKLNDPGRSYPLRYWYDTDAKKGRCTFKQQVTATYSATLCGPQKEQLKLIFDGGNYLKPTSTIITNERDYSPGFTGTKKTCTY